MVERISGIIPIRKVNHYEDNQQSSRDSLKKRPHATFQNILEQKMSNGRSNVSEPYQVSIVKRPG